MFADYPMGWRTHDGIARAFDAFAVKIDPTAAPFPIARTRRVRESLSSYCDIFYPNHYIWMYIRFQSAVLSLIDTVVCPID